MKTNPQDVGKSAPRGLRALAFLGGSLVLALGGLLAVASSGRELPPRAMTISDPLTDAKVAFVDGDFAGAEKFLRGLSGDEAKTLLARVLLESGRCKEAWQLFGEALKADVKNIEAVRGLAVSSQRLGRLDLAVLYWARAAELRKDDARVWRELGLCQREKGDPLGAMSSLQQSLKLDQSQADLSGLLTQLATARHDPAGLLPSAAWTPGNALTPSKSADSLILGAPRPRIPDPAQRPSLLGAPIR